MSFRLNDGVRFAGTLTKWDEHEIDGSFGRRRWSDVNVADAWRIGVQLIDRRTASDWVLLAEILLGHENGTDSAERAFHRAREIDREIEPAIEAARSRAKAAREKRQRDREAVAAERLRTLSPEAGPFGEDPWPAVIGSQQDAASKAARDAATRITQRLGLTLERIESQHFIVCTDLDRRTGAIWAQRLDELHEAMLRFLTLPAKTRLFNGRAVVLISSERDQFRLVEADAFDYLPRGGDSGICHYRGADVFINACHPGDDDELWAALATAATRGMLHRHRSPRRLPPWANEGLAEVLAVRLGGAQHIDAQRRPVGLSFVRSGGNVGAIMALQYDDDRWHDPQQTAGAVSYLLVDFLFRQFPHRVTPWLDAVKDGHSWKRTFRPAFAATWQEFLDTFIRYTRVND